MTIKEQETNIEKLNSKLMELAITSAKVIGITELSILKIGSVYGDLSNIALLFSGEGHFIERTKKSFTNIKTGLNKLSSSIDLTTAKTKLATIATKAYHAVANPIGIAVIASAVVGVGLAMALTTKKENEIIKAAKEHNQALEEQIKSWEE